MLTMALAIAEFILHLFTGQVWAAWRAHKINEAQNAKNQAEALSDSAAVDELRNKWTIKP